MHIITSVAILSSDKIPGPGMRHRNKHDNVLGSLKREYYQERKEVFSGAGG